MADSIIGALAPGLIVGLVLYYWERRQKRNDAKAKGNAELQVEADLRRLDLEVATAQLSFATAMAIKRGHANGEIEVALESYNNAMDKFRRFERKQMASDFKGRKESVL